MADKENERDAARNIAAAGIFSHMATEEKAQSLLRDIRALPDEALNVMAQASGVPEEHFGIHRAMVRNEGNAFTDELTKVDGLLQAGDVILMTGRSRKSQALASAQRLAYSNARSSHVALVHADFICVDAMPVIGTTNRIVSEVLTDVQDDWRVIRFKGLRPEDLEIIARACVFYLAQPYSIRPSAATIKKFSYCSELARKVYSHGSLQGTGIPANLVIKPADFDRLADSHSGWQDVTETVRPAIDFCRKYPALVKVSAKLFIDGLKLNRARYEERTALMAKIRASEKAGRIPPEKAAKAIAEIQEIERNLHNKFWDVNRSG
jgi:hypothetical protein